MSRSFIRNVTMGSLLMMLAMFAATALAQAQSSDQIRAKIPFDFVVGDRKLPAGEYFIGTDQTTNNIVLAISSRTCVVKTLTTPVVIGTRTNEAKLVFHRYGDQYFLFQAWQVGVTTGRTVPKSRAERDIEQRARVSTPVGAANRGIVETVPVVAYAH